MTHMKSHTSDRLPCPACSKPFLTRYLLNQVSPSLKVHTILTPYFQHLKAKKACREKIPDWVKYYNYKSHNVRSSVILSYHYQSLNCIFVQRLQLNARYHRRVKSYHVSKNTTLTRGNLRWFCYHLWFLSKIVGGWLVQGKKTCGLAVRVWVSRSDSKLQCIATQSKYLS